MNTNKIQEDGLAYAQRPLYGTMSNRQLDQTD